MLPGSYLYIIVFMIDRKKNILSILKRVKALRLKLEIKLIL